MCICYMQNGMDNRPYVNVTVFGKTYLSLLDSGASISCFGDSLAEEIMAESKSVSKFKRSVKTADGQRQIVAGSITAEIAFGDKTDTMKFLIIPSLKQNIICGMDFWKLFDLRIVDRVCEISSVDNDKCELSSVQQRQLEAIILLFPSSERETA